MRSQPGSTTVKSMGVLPPPWQVWSLPLPFFILTFSQQTRCPGPGELKRKGCLEKRSSSEETDRSPFHWREQRRTISLSGHSVTYLPYSIHLEKNLMLKVIQKCQCDTCQTTVFCALWRSIKGFKSILYRKWIFITIFMDFLGAEDHFTSYNTDFLLTNGWIRLFYVLGFSRDACTD